MITVSPRSFMSQVLEPKAASLRRPEDGGKVADDVLKAIWKIVHERGLEVGAQLPSIRELADQLQVKPTVVRDALLQAQAMGFLKILPRAGAFLQTAAPGARAAGNRMEHILPNVFQAALLQDEHN